MRRSGLAVLLLFPMLAGCGARGGATTSTRPAARPAATCPRSDRAKSVSHTPGAGTSLVPGPPVAVLLCRYSGLNAHRRFVLIDQRLVTAEAANLVRDLDRLRPMPPGVYNCPADSGTKIITFFRYPSLPEDPVTVQLSGCRDAGNGHLGRWAAVQGGPELIVRLEALTRG